jgi:hypothetical protein
MCWSLEGVLTPWQGRLYGDATGRKATRPLDRRFGRPTTNVPEKLGTDRLRIRSQIMSDKTQQAPRTVSARKKASRKAGLIGEPRPDDTRAAINNYQGTFMLRRSTESGTVVHRNMGAA